MAENKKKKPAEIKISNKREASRINISATIAGKRSRIPAIHKLSETDSVRKSWMEAAHKRIKRKTDFRRKRNGKTSAQFMMKEKKMPADELF